MSSPKCKLFKKCQCLFALQVDTSDQERRIKNNNKNAKLISANNTVVLSLLTKPPTLPQPP